MKILYSRWLENSQTAQDVLEQLLSLFTHILIHTNGDVDEALQWMQIIDNKQQIFSRDFTMEKFIEELKERGLIREETESYMLTAKGAQRIRQDALNEIFTSLKKSPDGFHDIPDIGTGVDRQSETKKFHFGDTPTNINLTQTLTNAFRRDGIETFSLQEEDIEVYETEHQTSCATILMLDVSHSMVLYGEDRITPAKRVALALSELIMTRYPKDKLHIILFGDDATEISVKELPFVGVGPFHTNTREGLKLARNLLRRTGNMNKQIFMVTDGKPSAMFEDNGRLYKNSFGLDPRIVNKTLDEAVACRREKVTITTFMVARDPYLINFVEELTKANKGRAYYTGLGNLGEYIFVDYIRNRRKIVH